MEYGVFQRKGLVAVIGAAGLGKTILLRAFVRDHLSSTLKIFYLSNNRVRPAGLISALCREVRAAAQPDGPGSPFKQLQQALIREYEQGNRVVLLVDDAQDLPEEALQTIPFLSDLEARSEKLLQVVLAGRPKLRQILEKSEFRHLKQRLALIVTLAPLNGEESRDYIRFRLEKAGAGDRPLFTRRALKCIGKLAGGIPRKINVLCSNALLMGYGPLPQSVTKKNVEELVRALEYPGQKTARASALPAAVCALVLAGFLFLAAHYHFAGQKVEPFLPSLNGSPSTGSIAVGRVAEEGVSEAAILGPSWWPPIVNGRLFPKPADPVPDAPNPLPSFLENEIVRSDSGKALKTSPPDKNRIPDGKGPAEKPKKAVSRNSESVPIIRVVREGDSFSRLVLDVYGTSNRLLWDHVRQHNPGLKEFHRLRVGDKIVFPDREALVDSKEKTGEITDGPGFRENGEKPALGGNHS